MAYQTTDPAAIEEQIEEAQDSGKEVYSLNWQNEWGGGLVWVVRHRRRYYAFSTEDIEPGPYPSLEEALARGAGEFGGCDVEITCPVLSARRLVKLLACHEPGHVIRVNDQLWRMDAVPVRLREDE